MEAEITLNVWGTRTGRRVFYDALRLRLRLRLGSFRAVFSRGARRARRGRREGVGCAKIYFNK
jgi:hypothetical protein